METHKFPQFMFVCYSNLNQGSVEDIKEKLFPSSQQNGDFLWPEGRVPSSLRYTKGKG